MTTVSKHLLRHPHTRAPRLIQLQKEDAMLQQLRQEIGMQAVQRPAHVSWWRRLLSVVSSQEPKQ